MIRITQIKISIDEPVSKVKSLVLKKLRLQEADLLNRYLYQLMQDIEAKLILSILLTLNLKMNPKYCLKKLKMFL